ncbi:MAG: FAD-dependent oxidoreductase [Pseudomonadota bacterium]
MPSRHLPSRRRFLGAVALACGATLAGPMRAAERSQVVVVGAGLAGLRTAMLLESYGFHVRVLEAADRVGGRMYTLEDVPGRPEAGGLEVGKSYGRLRSIGAAVGVGFTPPPPRSSGWTIAGEDLLLDAAGWAEAPGNPLTEAERAITPPALLFHYLRGAPELKDWPGAAAFEDLSVGAWLERRGASAAAVGLIDRNYNGIDVASASTGFLLHAMAVRMGSPPGSDRIVGGSQRLPEAMADTLAATPELNRKVVAVTEAGNGVELRCEDGTRIVCDQVVLATPLPALRRVAIEAPLPAPIRGAIDALPYTPITQVHFGLERAFWEDDGLPPNLWCDDPLGRVFANTDAEGNVISLTAWINGPASLALPADDIARWATDRLAALRPASRGAVKALQVVDWTRDASTGGAYSTMAVGQPARFMGLLTTGTDRIRFAGEHCFFDAPGMESAVASGEIAALGVLKALDGSAAA